MNDTFSLKRFGYYALRHYYENRLYYLFLIIATALAVLLATTEFRFFEQSVTTSQNSRHIEISPSFSIMFVFIGIAFSLFVIHKSTRGVSGKGLDINEMLIPCSHTERFAFMVLNSTIFAILVYSAIFSAVTSYTEGLYLYGNNVCIQRGLFCNADIPTEYIGKVAAKDQFSYGDLVFHKGNSYKINLFMNVFIVSSYLFSVAALLWGAVTFKSYAIIKSAVLHAVVVIGGLVALFVYGMNLMSRIFTINDGFVSVYIPDFILMDNLLWISTLLPIPAFLYLLVTWLKLKNIEIK